MMLSGRKRLLLASAILIAGAPQLLTGSSARPAIEGASALPSSVQPRSAERVKRVTSLRGIGEVESGWARLQRISDPSSARELFVPSSWYSPPPPPPPPPPSPPAEPTAPPLPYAFLGSYTDSNDATVYFVTREDRVYDVRLGDTIDQDYSVDVVENEQLVFTYKPLNVRQFLPTRGNP